MKTGITVFALVVALIAYLTLHGCSRNVPWVKDHSSEAAKQLGFEIVGYAGYTWNPLFGGGVWYTLRKSPDNGITYQAQFDKWGDEVHVYSLKALDAISPQDVGGTAR